MSVLTGRMHTSAGESTPTISRCEISGPQRDQFRIVAAPRQSLAGAERTTVAVQFAPTGLGAKTAALVVTSNDADEGTYKITLAGTCAEVLAPGGK